MYATFTLGRGSRPDPVRAGRGGAGAVGVVQTWGAGPRINPSNQPRVILYNRAANNESEVKKDRDFPVRNQVRAECRLDGKR